MTSITGSNRAGEMAVFVAVAEHGSLTHAARGLGLSPSAVSKLISRLEDRLGVRLLQRTTRRVTLTAEGRLFNERAREILEELDAVEELVGSGRLRPRGMLRVSLSHGFGMSQIVPLVPAFGERYPDIELQLAFADRRLDLVAEGIDLAIRLGPIRDEALIARRLGDHGRIVCAAPAYLARHGAPATPADLVRHNCVLFDQPDYLNQWPFRTADATVERVRIRGNFRSDNGDALIELLLAGLGIANAADFVALPLIAAGRLVPLLADYAVDERTPIHAVYPQRRHVPAKVRVFIDFLATALRRPPWLDAGMSRFGTIPAKTADLGSARIEEFRARIREYCCQISKPAYVIMAGRPWLPQSAPATPNLILPADTPAEVRSGFCPNSRTCVRGCREAICCTRIGNSNPAASIGANIR